MSNQSALLGLDTAATSAGSAAVLLLGARSMNGAEFTTLAMFQLIATSAVALQRATLLQPALAAQRTLGAPGAIPRRWSIQLVIPFGAFVGLVMPLALVPRELYVAHLGLTMAGATALLIQDLFRFHLYSRSHAGLAALADSFGAISFIALGALMGGESWERTAGIWVATAWITAGLFVILGRPFQTADYAKVTLRSTLALGRWSGLDNALASFANLLPMVATSLALASPLAGTYRLLQVVLGPLNIINSTMYAVFGRSSWRLTGLDEINRLGKRSRRISAMLAATAAAYLSIAFPVAIWFTGVTSDSLGRVVGIYAFAAILGAIQAPLTAAALALGYQFVGLLIRVVVVLAAVSTTVLAMNGTSAIGSDPIGVVTVISSLLGLVGWGTGYVLALRRERRRYLP